MIKESYSGRRCAPPGRTRFMSLRTRHDDVMGAGWQRASALGASLAAAAWLCVALLGSEPARLELPRPSGSDATQAAEPAIGVSADSLVVTAPLRAYLPAAHRVPFLPRRCALQPNGLDLSRAIGISQDAPLVPASPPGLDLEPAVGLRPPPRLDPPPLAPSAPTRAARGPPSLLRLG